MTRSPPDRPPASWTTPRFLVVPTTALAGYIGGADERVGRHRAARTRCGDRLSRLAAAAYAGGLWRGDRDRGRGRHRQDRAAGARRCERRGGGHDGARAPAAASSSANSRGAWCVSCSSPGSAGWSADTGRGYSRGRPRSPDPCSIPVPATGRRPTTPSPRCTGSTGRRSTPPARLRCCSRSMTCTGATARRCGSPRISSPGSRACPIMLLATVGPLGSNRRRHPRSSRTSRPTGPPSSCDRRRRAAGVPGAP